MAWIIIDIVCNIYHLNFDDYGDSIRLRTYWLWNLENSLFNNDTSTEIWGER